MVAAPIREGAMDGQMDGPLRFWVDRCDREEISGWIDEDGPVESISIELDGKWIATLSPTMSRPDLVEHGMAERRGFAFPLEGYFGESEAIATISLRANGNEFFRRDLLPARIDLRSGDAGKADDRLLQLSQVRWKGDEPEAGLTWGAMMDGRSLWQVYSRARTFQHSDKILEIGPGYGRLLETALENSVPFASYVGVDLSEARVARLSEKFGDKRIQFVVGDINNWRWHEPFDVVICSATFEHLFPDCQSALANIRRQVAPGATLFIDFIYSDESKSTFEEDKNGTFLRWYSEQELRSIFHNRGYTVLDVVSCVLGTAVDGDEIRRNVLIASPTRAKGLLSIIFPW
jgi:SAM-dependent methyltransferase